MTNTETSLPPMHATDILPLESALVLDAQAFDDFEKALDDALDNERLMTLLARPKRWDTA